MLVRMRENKPGFFVMTVSRTVGGNGSGDGADPGHRTSSGHRRQGSASIARHPPTIRHEDEAPHSDSPWGGGPRDGFTGVGGAARDLPDGFTGQNRWPGLVPSETPS